MTSQEAQRHPTGRSLEQSKREVGGPEGPVSTQRAKLRFDSFRAHISPRLYVSRPEVVSQAASAFGLA